MSKTFLGKTDKKFDASISSTFFFNRVFGCFSATKTSCKKTASKIFNQKIDKTIQSFASVVRGGSG
jgi:hypothetical protein